VIGDRARNANFVPETQANASQEKMVNVWSMSIAETSLHRFQVIFFVLISLASLFLLFLIWLIWKCFPVIKQAGGLKSLLVASPFHLETAAPEKPVEEPVEEHEEFESEEGLEPDMDAEQNKPPPKK
jgi:type III secretion protein J